MVLEVCFSEKYVNEEVLKTNFEVKTSAYEKMVLKTLLWAKLRLLRLFVE